MSYRTNRKTGGIFPVSGTPYVEPPMTIAEQTRRFPGSRMFYDMLGDTGLTESDFWHEPVLEFFTPISKRYEDVTFDFWRTETGWYGISSSQEAPTVHFQSRPTVGRYLDVYHKHGSSHGRVVEE